MTDDIVERLRDADTMTKTKVADVLSEAADEIERLRWQNVELMRLYYKSEGLE